MSKGAVILVAVMGLALAGSAWASSSGFGVPQPEKQPLSIREESARGDTSGGSRRYRPVFISGGVYHGK
ncbi:MAG: hypothetical protein KDA33_02630 [Phycisphaerales bacterium]|nr:hypothetical protein [Phycisphaerales bacterium]